MSTNRESIVQKIVVFITFLIAIFLYYSNPDQFVSDNSLFYPVVAQNIFETGVSTFNGYIETYGYQPLWMIFNVLAVAISSVLSLDPLIVIGFIYHLFLAGAIYLIFKISERWDFFSAPIVALILVFMFISNGTLHNMESALALFFILFTLYYALKSEVATGKNFFILGLLIGLTFLSRLDLAFFGIIVTIYTLFSRYKEIMDSPAKLLYFAGGVSTVVLPYLIHNELAFGNLLPMSEALTGGFPTLEYAWENIYPYGTVSLFIAFIEWGVAWMVSSRQARTIILILSLSTISQIFYVAMFQSPQSWYFITGFINFALIIGYFVKKIDITLLNRAVLASLVIFIIATSYLKIISNYALSAHILRLAMDKVGKSPWIFSDVSLKKEFGEKFGENLPENATVYAWELPGTLAYYGKLKVFSANGLSNGLIANSRYETELLEKDAKSIFERYNIGHVVVPMTYANWFWYESLMFERMGKGEYRLTLYSKSSHKKRGTMYFKEDDIVFKTPSIYSKVTNVSAFKLPDTAERNIWKD